MNDIASIPPVADPITFAGSPLDRVSAQRKDADWLDNRLHDSKTRFLPLHDLKVPVELGREPRLNWRPRGEVSMLLRAGAPCVLLGVDDGIAHFAVDVTAAPPQRHEGSKWLDVRSAAMALPAGEAAITAQARSMLDWHNRHGFCAVCSQPTRMEDAGYSRRCTSEACKAQHFPRTDPVAIMLTIWEDKVLLGRQPRFVPGVYSALAGFLEPGESIEEAVRREIFEEAGIKVGKVRYIASQPWPFPSSLMIGCIGEALTNEITVDQEELEEARWFTREELANMVRLSTTQETPRMPPPLSLAHQLARAWLHGA